MDWLGISRRRLGAGMLLFGLTGMLMAGIVALALIGGAFAARDLDTRLQEDQARLAASLTRLTVTMESLALTTQHAGDTLTTSSATLTEARDVLDAAAATSVTLSHALDVEILGSRPFARASESLATLARTLTAFRDKAETLAANLARNATDAASMTEELRTLKTQVNELATRVTAFDRIDEIVGLVLGGILLAGLLTAWVAVGAGACAWAGWRLRRAAPESPPGTSVGQQAAAG